MLVFVFGLFFFCWNGVIRWIESIANTWLQACHSDAVLLESISGSIV
jgi:hypothetical protein